MVVIEGDYLTDELYCKVKKDYMNPDILVKDIKEKYELGPSVWRGIVRRIKEDCGWDRGMMKGKCAHPNPKNYCYDKYRGRYQVCKDIDKTRVYYGHYHDEKIAKLVVEELKKVDWDKNKLPAIKEKLGV